LSAVLNHDYPTSSESSNSLSSRASSRSGGVSNQVVHLTSAPPQIPPRNPQRLQRREPRMNNLTQAEERGSCATASDTCEVAVHPRGTGSPLRATEQKAHEPEPLPQIAASCPQGFETCSHPPEHRCRAPRTKYSAVEEGRRPSKSSVCSNIYKARNKSRSEAPSPSTHGQNDHAASHLCTPSPQRTDPWVMDFIENESSA
jgi:hypothetical protein